MYGRMRDVSSGRGRGDRGASRNNPYDRASRPSNSRVPSTSAWDAPSPETPAPASYPPASISIKGSGGPYHVVVGNVAKGTTAEDIRLTFEPFGDVVDVVEREPPSLNHPSISFDVYFARKEEGKAACHSLNGCLADGRVLSVAAPASDANPAFTSFNGSVSAAARQRVGQTGTIEPGPAPLPRGPARPYPSELSRPYPQEMAAAAQPARRPAPGAARIPHASVVQPVAGGRGGGRRDGAAAAAPLAPQPKSLQSRLGLGLTENEKMRVKAVKQQQQKAAATKGPNAPVVAGGRGRPPVPKSLKERISIPLAERLAAASTSASDPAKLEAKKRKRENAKAKKAAGGMEVD